MIARPIFMFAATLLLAGMLSAPPVAATSPDEFVRITGKLAFNSLGTDISAVERAKRFRNILTKNFDVPVIAKFVLGRYWRIADENQRVEYVSLFEDFIVQAYAHRFKDLVGKQFIVKQSRKINARDVEVSSEVIIASGKPPLRVNWRVRGTANNYRITDVVVEGISMSVTQRDEFAAVIRSNGGKVEGLLAALRKKTKK